MSAQFAFRCSFVPEKKQRKISTMEIQDIKEQLTLATVLSHYNLKPDKHLQLCCPFHPDKTPSMKVYYKTHTAYCFSSNCPTHGKSLDVIDFVMHKEGIDKHGAIVKAKELIGGDTGGTATAMKKLTRSVVLSKMMTYFKNGVHNSKPAQEYLQSRHLDHEQIEVGYNSGQFHHGARKEKALIESCVRVGLLLDKGMIGRTGGKAYSPFGKGGIVFALKNREGKVISMYFRSTTSSKSKHFYLRDRQGLYPGYPKSDTRKLILTEAIVDAATLLMQKELMKECEVLSLFGTNGLTDEHRKAISDLRELEEVVMFFDGDEGGNKAAEKYKAILSDELQGITISKVNTPEGEDINSLLDGHEPEILHQLIDNRTLLFSSSEVAPQGVEVQQAQTHSDERKSELDTSNPSDIRYKGKAASYSVKGFKTGGLDSLKVSLKIWKGAEDYRTRIELYEHKQAEGAAKKAAEMIGADAATIEKDLSKLTTLLEQYRESNRTEERREERKTIQVPQDTQPKCIELLKSKDYFHKLSELIGNAGVIGEEKSRLLLYVIASTYKMSDTLHALVQGTSGSGKTHLISKISELMPEEDMIPLTRVTESSFYNYGEHELENKLLVMEDLDGLKEEAFLAFRELQSRGMLNSSTSVKDEQGNIRAALKRVYGPIASLSATTKGEVYEDNMSRCLIIAVDESEEQTSRIIEAENLKADGSIDTSQEQKVSSFLRHCMRLIKPYEVVNPYANKVKLPAEAQKIRRLNQLYQSFIKQITILHQYQRKRDSQGRLIAEKEDLRIACRILFDSIVLKVDELDGSLRDFYEKLKAYVNEKGGREYEFTRREVRQALKVSRTRQHAYMWQLQDLEYVYPVGGHANRGYHYRIAYWDSLEALRAKIQDKLDQQLDQL